jgi:iron complex outermembrane receptor protein
LRQRLVKIIAPATAAGMLAVFAAGVRAAPGGAPVSGAASAPASAPAAKPGVAPPELVKSVEATYPASELGKGAAATLVLLVTVGADGTVNDVAVAESGGAAFDAAASAAVRSWVFRPARRDGMAVPSRIRIPFRFAAPGAGPTSAPASMPASAPVGTASGPTSAPAFLPAFAIRPETLPAAPESAEAAPLPPGAVDVTVRGHRAPPPRASSDFVVDHAVLVAAPHATAGALLATAPGVYVSRPEGEAVAHEIYLRGFDAEHGQDIELSVGPVPLNEPSHIHGQGYADLGVVIPETVRSLRVTEGVYDPHQGDFAVAGSAHFDLGVPDRGTLLKASYGSFRSLRALALWAPEGEPEETFAAATLSSSAGFGENRGSFSAAATGQYAFDGPRGTRGLVHAAAYGARASLAGVLRLDDVEAGTVGYYDAYPDPAATSQSAFASHFDLSLSLARALPTGARTSLDVWALASVFRLREDFTGYLERSEMRPEWVGRGDLVEQSDLRFALGAAFSHRTATWRPAAWLSGAVELGTTFRADFITQAQNLLQPPQNETWDRRVDAAVRGADAGFYADADVALGRYLHLRGGLRADVLYYDVDDKLGNFLPSFQIQTHIVGFRRTAIGLAWGPRATLEATPAPWLGLFASYGEGYRSPQARLLQEGENAPYAKVRSAEVGFRLKLFGGERLTFTGALYGTHLSTDLAFDPGEGSITRIGPTTRLGAVAHLVARPVPWVVASLSITYVHATLDAPPPATADNPSPPYTPGELLPYVPPVVVRADVAVEHHLVRIAGEPLRGRAGVGFSYLSPRPLPYGTFGDPVVLLDASASVRYRNVELGAEAYNLTGAKYAATEYSFTSDWGTRPIPSLVPARHIAAGAPRTVLATAALHF